MPRSYSLRLRCPNRAVGYRYKFWCLTLTKCLFSEVVLGRRHQLASNRPSSRRRPLCCTHLCAEVEYRQPGLCAERGHVQHLARKGQSRRPDARSEDPGVVWSRCGDRGEGEPCSGRGKKARVAGKAI